MKAERKWQIEGVAPAEVIDCVTEWLESYQFIVECKTGPFRKRLLAKTEQYSPPETLAIFFEFELSKTRGGTSLKAEYCGRNPIDMKELDITTHTSSMSVDNPSLYYLREYAKSVVDAFEKYFDLEKGKASVWHDTAIDMSVLGEAKIHETLTEEVTKLRDIAKKLGIEKIGDLRRLQRSLVSLCRSKPEVFGGVFGTQITGGYTRLTPILEGSFWRRGIPEKNE